VLLVSLDPGADTPRRARRFLAQTALAGRAHYLSGPARVLRRIWGGYRVDPAAAGIEGAAIVLLLDRAGRERVLFGLEQLTPEGLAHDLRKLGALARAIRSARDLLIP
jgi:protein SCO1/2